ncbi:MAG: hypothetical protein HYZ17_14505 [Betaproteobacteria bacterium]|nr:hypothetical protein [Betaproteobacteria bacterium]
MLNLLKKLFLGFGKVLLALALAFGLYLAYGVYAESSASEKATLMCASIISGAEASMLRDRAILDGASDSQTRWLKRNGQDLLLITYIGLPPFSRHTCSVTTENGRVVAAQRGYLD